MAHAASQHRHGQASRLQLTVLHTAVCPLTVLHVLASVGHAYGTRTLLSSSASTAASAIAVPASSGETGPEPAPQLARCPFERGSARCEGKSPVGRARENVTHGRGIDVLQWHRNGMVLCCVVRSRYLQILYLRRLPLVCGDVPALCQLRQRPNTCLRPTRPNIFTPKICSRDIPRAQRI